MKWFYAALAAMLFSTNVGAQDLKVGHGVVCDMPAQLEQLYSGDMDAFKTRLEALNSVVQPTPCGFAEVAYLEESEVMRIQTADGFYRIEKILVLGIHLPDGWQRLKQPAEQYTAFYEKAQDV